jgi:SSS family solute:Na+ symporter
MWPHTFGSIYTAKSAIVIRKNAIVLPLYQLILLFVFFVGFAVRLESSAPNPSIFRQPIVYEIA